VSGADGNPTSFKVGISRGSLCAGVIGNFLPRFSIFGDTVNTASRMASTASPCGHDKEYRQFIHLPEHVAHQLDPQFKEDMYASHGMVLQPRGSVDIKGKGQMLIFAIFSRNDRGFGLPTIASINEEVACPHDPCKNSTQ